MWRLTWNEFRKRGNLQDLSARDCGETGQQYTVFQPAEVELADVLETILSKVRDLAPSRIIIDRCRNSGSAGTRLAAVSSAGAQPQTVPFEGRDCTTLLLDERFRNDPGEKPVQTIAHGVISLEVLQRSYGTRAGDGGIEGPGIEFSRGLSRLHHR